MKHFAKSPEITAISRPFGKQNHSRWNISGLHIIRLETVIVYTAFSEGHEESDRGKKGQIMKKASKGRLLPRSKLQEIATLQLCHE